MWHFHATRPNVVRGSLQSVLRRVRRRSKRGDLLRHPVIHPQQLLPRRSRYQRAVHRGRFHLPRRHDTLLDERLPHVATSQRSVHQNRVRGIPGKGLGLDDEFVAFLGLRRIVREDNVDLEELVRPELIVAGVLSDRPA